MSLDDLRDWFALMLPDYTLALGQWVEPPNGDTSRYVVIQAAGGGAPVLDVRYPRFRVILLGRRQHPEDAPGIMTDAGALVTAGIEDSRPCNAALLRATGEPTGPGLTTENRAWASFTIEVIF